MFKNYRNLRLAAALLALMTLSACAVKASVSSGPVTPLAPESVFTVQAEGQRVIVRALTRASACPDIAWDATPAQAMAVRAAPARVGVRSDAAQADSKEAQFDVLTCEAAWPAGVLKARVAGRDVPAPKADIRRIVILADTGCRMKASENAYQPCNDLMQWPFAQIAQSAADLKPDLVVHIGDMHYRESPCPVGNTGCANSPWGYGYDAWQADFFNPAKPLLAAAPWVFVRGNHESCFRAGQGWFRFMDTQTWQEARSCNDPRFDLEADYSDPYAVVVGPDTQFVVFDSSKTSGKPFSEKDHAYGKYKAQMLAVDQLTKQKPHSFFMSHHPLLAIAPAAKSKQARPGGNAGLQSVFEALHPQRLFPDSVDVTLHGHIHFFEAMSFKTTHPASLVLGNSGSANDGDIPATLPPGMQPYPGAIVEDYAARSDYGFATLDRVDLPGSSSLSRWLLTEYSVAGEPVFRCDIHGSKSKCQRIGS
jgi:Calcineurin-like phosphoesterase